MAADAGWVTAWQDMMYGKACMTQIKYKGDSQLEQLWWNGAT